MNNDLPKWPFFIFGIITMLLINLVQECQDKKESERLWREIEERSASWNKMDTVIKKNVIKSKDSIDILIEQRATRDLKTTIFAGINFGDSPAIVEARLNNKQYKKIQVPDGDKVSTVIVDDYDTKYYQGHLAMLILYAEEDELYDALEVLYTTKYGKTKNGKWCFSNCEIDIEYGRRLPYSPSWDKGYNASNYGNYYHSYRGNRSSSLTKDASFLKIIYKDFKLLYLLQRQEIEADSLERVRLLEAKEEEKKKARKLATEVATGI
jgi:hypothetical protein